MRRLGLALALVLLVLPALPRRARAAGEFYTVIVNAANPLSALPAAEVSRMFLRKSVRWPDGSLVLPIDLPEGSPVRASFSKEIHGRGVDAVKAYWQQVIFSGGGVPPPEEGAGTAVVDYVRSHPGAIGYVSVRTPLGEGVKVLKVTR